MILWYILFFVVVFLVFEIFVILWKNWLFRTVTPEAAILERVVIISSKFFIHVENLLLFVESFIPMTFFPKKVFV